MAALHYATATTTTTYLRHRYRQFASGTLNYRRPVFVVSSFSTALPPTKPPRRRNRLRQKILKTLKEPIIPQLPPLNQITPVKILLLQESEESGAIQETEESDKPVNEEVQKLEELREEEVSASAASLDGNVGILGKNQILKYGLWLVGAFVFQTVCAIWVFGSGGMDNENEILNGTEKNSLLEGDGNEKMGVRNSADSLIYVDELEMERKIEEIRVMAREAREKERLESKRKGLDSEDREGTDGGKYPKSGIEEEVDNRLIKLRKKLKNARDRMPVASVGYSKKDNTRTDGVETGELDESESNGALLFKKKYKFKGLSGDTVEKPKGFIGSDDTRVKSGSSEKGDELIKSVNGDNDTVGLGDAVKRTDMLDVDPKGSDAVRVVEEDKKKSTSEMTESTRNTRKKVAKVKGISKQVKGKSRETKDIALKKDNGRSALGTVQHRKSNAEVVKSRKSNALDIAAVPNELSKGNSSLKSEGNAESAVKRKSETDFWWMSLPYVLAILMRRGRDGEGGEGLYTLKSISSTEDQTSHIVAFEDRADATNFCYLLQSFFDDLEDFIADVVPLTVKELNEAVKSYTKRVIVVKRGQLKLYAGQPLTDAETALRAMIKKD